jgi:hypothetical protein
MLPERGMCGKRDDVIVARDAAMRKRPTKAVAVLCWRPATSDDQPLGGIVSVTVCPGCTDSELLIGARFDPIGSTRKRTEFAGPMM